MDEYENSIKQLSQSIDKAGLTKYKQSILDLCLPSVKLLTNETVNKLKIGTSKFGGIPDVYSKFIWPAKEDKPLPFLAQINLEKATQYDVSGLLPNKGMLYFFYDGKSTGLNINDKDGWKVLYYPENINLYPAKLPIKQEPKKIGNVLSFSFFMFKRKKQSRDLTIYDQKPIIFSTEATIPGFEEGTSKELNFTEDEIEAYWEDIRIEDERSNRMLGYPEIIQSENMQLECFLINEKLLDPNYKVYKSSKLPEYKELAKQWILLLQIDSDYTGNMHWGDAGRVYFWIKKDDLKSLKFDDVWMIFECF